MTRPILYFIPFLFLGLTAFEAPVLDEGIMDVYDNFALSNSAASRCRLPDGSVYKNFVPNFQLVTKSAALYLKQKSPTTSDQAIGNMLETRYNSIDFRTSEIIAQEGCDGIKMRSVLQQFETLATMDPTVKSKRKRPPQN